MKIFRRQNETILIALLNKIVTKYYHKGNFAEIKEAVQYYHSNMVGMNTQKLDLQLFEKLPSKLLYLLLKTSTRGEFFLSDLHEPIISILKKDDNFNQKLVIYRFKYFNNYGNVVDLD